MRHQSEKWTRRATLTLCPWDGPHGLKQDLSTCSPCAFGREDALQASPLTPPHPRSLSNVLQTLLPNKGPKLGPAPFPIISDPAALSRSLSLQVGPFLGPSPHAMAALLDHSRSQLCPQSRSARGRKVSPLTLRERQGSRLTRALPGVLPPHSGPPHTPLCSRSSGSFCAVPLQPRWSLPAAFPHTCPGRGDAPACGYKLLRGPGSHLLLRSPALREAPAPQCAHMHN